LRETVRFAQTTNALLDVGHHVFVEVSPHPVLTVAIQDSCEQAAASAAVVVGSLRREHGGPQEFLTAAAGLFVRGVAVDWPAVFTGSGFAGSGPRRVELPTYAFQRQRFWLDAG